MSTSSQLQQNHESWKPEMLSLSVMTCPRKEDYVIQTLDGLIQSDAALLRLQEVVIAVDAETDEHLKQHRNNPRFSVALLSPEEAARVENVRLHQRACNNFFRSLTLPRPGYKGLLICEDDLIFRPGWIDKLCDSLNEMDQDGLTDFVLSAYSSHDHEHPSFRRGTFYSSYLAASFFGSQCLFFTASQVAPIALRVWNRGANIFCEPYDILVNEHCTEAQNLYATRFPLVQHVGFKSTGLGGFFNAYRFDEPWPQ